MKVYNICGCGFVLSGIVILIVGVINIPSEMPPIIRQNGESQQEASDRTVREYNESIINSKGFLLAMVGTGLICLSIISLVIMIKRFNRIEDIPVQHSRVHPRVIQNEPHVQVQLQPNIYELYPPKPYITIIRPIPKSTAKNESKVKPTDII
jgi:hypothetical protein